jgi:hypothetical protein
MARRGVPVKTLKKMLKSKGLKTTGKKATLTRRAKKAHQMRGGARLDFKVKVTLTEVFSPKPPKFVAAHSDEIIDWIAEKKSSGSPKAIGLTHAKGDEFTVTVQYNDDPKKATVRHPAKSAADAKRTALEYLDMSMISDKIEIDEKMYDVVVDPID